MLFVGDVYVVSIGDVVVGDVYVVSIGDIVVVGDVYVPAVWQAPMLRNGREFPVIVLSHGLGGNRTTYTTFCCNLASHGFVVAALEHR